MGERASAAQACAARGAGYHPDVLAAALSAVAALAVAQTTPPSCAYAFLTGLVFGDYDPLGANAAAPLDVSGQIQYQCKGGARPVVTLSAGDGGAFQPRRLSQGADSLAYNLYRDAGRTEVWGDGTAGTVTVSAGTGRVTLVVYGRIFPGQAAAAGDFADTVIATLNF